jgi:hypothetical protein
MIATIGLGIAILIGGAVATRSQSVWDKCNSPRFLEHRHSSGLIDLQDVACTYRIGGHHHDSR